MEKFACKNLGLDCDFETTGDTKEEVMKDMTPEQSADFAQKLEASIQPV